MQQVLFRVRKSNPQLDDDAFVEDVMNKLMEDYPEIKGYTYERAGSHHINILMWGDIEVVT